MTAMKNPIIVLTGPTASGKTAISYEIAHKYHCEIICTDSMTVYTGMDIGTDKPTREKLPDEPTEKNSDASYTIRGIRHHLLNIVNPDNEFNVAIFVRKVEKIISEVHSRGHIPLLVGGSVLYIDALIYQYSMPDVKPNPELRTELEGKSAEELFECLCSYDPDCEWTVDKHNKRRLIREIEVYEATGKPLSQQQTRSTLPENVLYLAVDRDREILYAKINRRVDEMFDEGFVDEVRELYKKYDHQTALQAAGYKQIIQYLNADITLDVAKEKTKQVHRNYAKRQLTWLRRNPDIHWINSVQGAEKAISEFLNI